MRARRFLLLLALICAAVIVWAYWTAISDPIVRHANIELLSSSGAKEVRVVLMSDIHVAGPDMPPHRLERIVRQANSLNPDTVLIAGDLVSDKRLASRKYSLSEAVTPLRGLRSRLGVFAVLGNHDHWRSAAAARAALNEANVQVLDNSASRAGPLVIGGLDDAFTKHDDLNSTVAAMKRAGGVPILLSHSPDPFPRLPGGVGLMLAGHTHCGQIRLPFIGAFSYMSEYGDRYACGLVAERGRTLIVSAGLGTSLLPLRLGVHPDMWLIKLTRRRVPSHTSVRR